MSDHSSDFQEKVLVLYRVLKFLELSILGSQPLMRDKFRIRIWFMLHKCKSKEGNLKFDHNLIKEKKSSKVLTRKTNFPKLSILFDNQKLVLDLWNHHFQFNRKWQLMSMKEEKKLLRSNLPVKKTINPKVSLKAEKELQLK